MVPKEEWRGRGGEHSRPAVGPHSAHSCTPCSRASTSLRSTSKGDPLVAWRQLARRPFPLLDNEGGDGTPCWSRASRPSSRQRWARVPRSLPGTDRPSRPRRRDGLRPALGVLRPRRSARWSGATATCPTTTRWRRGRAGSAPLARSPRCGSPHRFDRPHCPSARRRRCSALRGDRLQDEPAHPWGAAASERDYDRSSMASAMRSTTTAAGTLVLGRPAPVPALAPGGLRALCAPRRCGLSVLRA